MYIYVQYTVETRLRVDDEATFKVDRKSKSYLPQSNIFIFVTSWAAKG